MQPTTTGENRTGAAMAKDGVSAMLEANERWAPTQPIDTSLADAMRAQYIADADPLGSIPPPSTVQSMLKTGINKLMGARPDLLMNKVGERLAFERTGTRLYDALIVKYETVAGVGDAPGLSALLGSRGEDVLATLLRIRAEEHEHFLMLNDVMRELGGDPTAQTPCADVAATASMGLMQVVTDPRTTFAQSLDALLIAELADNAGWEMLVSMAEDAGEPDVAMEFQRAMAEEEEHLVIIKSWLNALMAVNAETAAV